MAIGPDGLLYVATPRRSLPGSPGQPGRHHRDDRRTGTVGTLGDGGPALQARFTWSRGSPSAPTAASTSPTPGTTASAASARTASSPPSPETGRRARRAAVRRRRLGDAGRLQPLGPGGQPRGRALRQRGVEHARPDDPVGTAREPGQPRCPWPARTERDLRLRRPARPDPGRPDGRHALRIRTTTASGTSLSVTDGDGNVTTVERDAAGLPDSGGRPRRPAHRGSPSTRQASWRR